MFPLARRNGAPLLRWRMFTLSKAPASVARLPGRRRPGLPGSLLALLALALLRVLEAADVDVPRWANRGRASPRRAVRAPDIEQKVSRSTRDSLGMVHHQLAVHIPVDEAGLPDNFEIVGIGLVEAEHR